MKRYFESRFFIGDSVYLGNADEKSRGVVIGVVIRPGGIIYDVQWPTKSSYHYDFELTDEYVPDF